MPGPDQRKNTGLPFLRLATWYGIGVMRQHGKCVAGEGIKGGKIIEPLIITGATKNGDIIQKRIPPKPWYVRLWERWRVPVAFVTGVIIGGLIF